MGQERNDCDARMTSNHSDVGFGGVGALDFTDKATGTNNVQRGNTKQTTRIVHTPFLEDFSNNGDGGVDGVGNNEGVCIRTVFSDGSGQVLDNGGVGVEQIITGHTGFARNTGGNDNNITALQTVFQLSITFETRDL